MQKCDHDDCFTCPYADCIANRGPQTARKKRAKMSRSEINRRYYLKKREEISARNKMTYRERKKEH